MRACLPIGYSDGLSGLTLQITFTFDFLGFSAVKMDAVEWEVLRLRMDICYALMMLLI